MTSSLGAEKCNTVTFKMATLRRPGGKFQHVTGQKGPEGRRGTVLIFLKLGAIRGWVVNAMFRLLCPQYRPGSHSTRDRASIGGGLDGTENLAYTEI
jgi:hypothetical protein